MTLSLFYVVMFWLPSQFAQHLVSTMECKQRRGVSFDVMHDFIFDQFCPFIHSYTNHVWSFKVSPSLELVLITYAVWVMIEYPTPNPSSLPGSIPTWGVHAYHRQWKNSWHYSFHVQSTQTVHPQVVLWMTATPSWDHNCQPYSLFCQLKI